MQGRVQLKRPQLESGPHQLDSVIAKILRAFCTRAEAQFAAVDPGIAILASLFAEVSDASARAAREELVDQVMTTWLERTPVCNSLSAYCGAAALMNGLSAAADCWLPARDFHRRIRKEILTALECGPWSNPAHDWSDYDLVTGPAGILLILMSDPAVKPADVERLASHLIALAGSGSMGAFRLAGPITDELKSWNAGAINLGLAHGVPGVLVALSAYARRGSSVPEGLLGRAAQWLMSEARLNDAGFTTWPPRAQSGNGRLRASSREAWCYGAPGVSWALWETAMAAGDDESAEFALSAFTQFEQAFDAEFHLNGPVDEQIAICHGAAGLLLLADAFERNAELPAARRLATRLEMLLLSRLDEIAEVGSIDLTLHGGATGCLAALLTHFGASRCWLAQFGLR